MANKRILIITPRFPYPEAGACEQDRAEGIRQLKRLGYDVRVIGKYFDWQNKDEIIEYWRKEGIVVDLVQYQQKKAVSFILDGAAAEYADPKMSALIEEVLSEFPADIAWFDYTYLWPLYRLFRQRHIPIVVRSINFEAFHYLDEDGRSFIHYLKFIPKVLTEFITARQANLLFSISPKERTYYQRIGARNAMNLPLRSLQHKLSTHTPRITETLHLFFSGSTYNVAHNRRALEFILKELAPALCIKYGDGVVFHVTGSKFPDDLVSYIRDNVQYEGFVEDMDTFLENMDIAVVPSFFGAGMQQKIFEPLARGFPTITNRRGIAGYPFVAGEDYSAAESLEEYISAIEQLQSFEYRCSISRHCAIKSRSLFSGGLIDSLIHNEIEKI